MRFATLISAMLHVAAVGVWFIIPASWRPVGPSDPIVPIEIISEAELSDRLSVVETRVEPEAEAVEQPAPEEREEQPPVPTTQPEQPQEQQPEPEPEPVQLPPEPEPEPEEQEPEPIEEPEPEPEQPKEEPKKEEPNKDPPKKDPPKQEPPKEPELDLSALESALTDLDREETNAPREAPTETGQAQQGDRDVNQVGLGDRLLASEEAKMKARMAECWSAQAFLGAPKPETLIVTLSFELNRDGSLKSTPKVQNAIQINTSGNPFWKVAERSAINAVIDCAPYNFLSLDRYNEWKSFEMTFNPAEMVGF
ncbi:hypothetical protein FF098_015400 [Parvularcula flava]|uniref:Uncharacterized protein n=1 Tax=Aquisalinus luteolus TaxID=1566827 RepID=A0A8J3ESH1_9PROT|nr:hypothetical protein [Aquisalinus luteolus]NHK29303.1 hypothetical protein [Aquisalinus luteolus]GGI01188.1 hypothetical protein GCM10011355_31240 [Aquisalinus luteolus]